MHFQIPPHGGELVNRILKGEERAFWLQNAASLNSIVVDARTIADIEMIACGAMSPLEGFMCRDDYNHVLEHMRLASGLPWPLPIVLGVSSDEADDFDANTHVALKDAAGTVLAILHLREKFVVDVEREAAKVFKTTDRSHPGVKLLLLRKPVLLGGDIDVVNMPAHGQYGDYRLAPFETRHAFEQRGWRRIVAFHTHNPIHRAHEYLQKCALEVCDGLLIQPALSEAADDNIPIETLVECYELLVENYFPQDRVMLNIFPGPMRYAGPREAVFHALTRKNYGCTHFIVGRNHADVGTYYGAYEAKEIFREFGPGELEISVLFYEDAVYCTKCMGMVTVKTCPHSREEHVSCSETSMRDMLQQQERPPAEVARPEIVDVLLKVVRRTA